MKTYLNTDNIEIILIIVFFHHMGNSGIRKIFFKGPEVESPYSSLYDMSVINIQKHEV